MRLEQLRELIDQRPFVPIRICMSDGSSYLVEDPNLVMLSRHTVFVGIQKTCEQFPSETVYLDPLHVTRAEPEVA